MNQREQVFEYLKEFGSITRMQAAGELGIFELSSRIGELEREGFEVPRETVKVPNRYGKQCRVTRYYAPTKWA